MAKSHRASWTGQMLIKVGDLAFPINMRMTKAIEADRPSEIHQFHEKCATRVSYKKVCDSCNVMLEAADIKRGVQTEEGTFVEIEKSAGGSSSTLRVLGFAPTTVDYLRMGDPYFLTPNFDRKKASAANDELRHLYFSLIQVMQQKNLMMLAEVVIRTRVRYLMVLPTSPLMAFTVRAGEDIRHLELEQPSELSTDAISIMADIIEPLTVERADLPERNPSKEMVRQALTAGPKAEVTVESSEDAERSIMDAMKQQLKQTPKEGKKRGNPASLFSE